MAAAAALGLGLVLAAGLVVALLAGVLVAAGRGARPDDTPAATLVAARQHAAVAAVLALAGGVVVALLLVSQGDGLGPVRLAGVPGLPAALGPLAGGLVALAVLAAGERTWPRPVGTVRTASLRRRTVAELAARRGRLLGGTTALGLACLAVFALTADATGRAVPALITSEAVAQGYGGGASGPYPGAPYALPLGAGLLAVAVVAGVVLHLVARRPAVAGTREEDDLALRRTSARSVLGVAQLASGGTVGVVLLVAGAALLRSGWLLGGWAAVALGLAVGLVSLGAAATACIPRPAPAPGAAPAGPRAGAQR
ncbi:hypothetical protein [Georgenia faecalis]|uniref:Integral membrane protein n=1 Tax=Georgenia faecalis TaxID=2483799 RepID=A0ABV9D6B4_9MICO|nr:hypothetical protein [Georgenia faecalis]